MLQLSLSRKFPSDSGLGDFGREGIQKFIDGHQCSTKCEQLGLKPLKDQEEKAETDSDAASGEE